MHFYDPSRTRLNAWRPCWLNSSVGIPSLQLTPHLTDPSKIVLTIFDGTRGLWHSTDLPLTSLVETVHFWTEDPEGTFQTLFGLKDWPRDNYKPPSLPPLPTSTPTPIEDLI
jgi:hypothetical protein